MRLSVFFVLLCVAQTFAVSSYSQQTRLTLEMRNAKVIEVLDEIENNSDYYFLFNQKLVDVGRKVDISVNQEEIKDILATVFKGTDVNYVVINRQIVLTSSKSKEENVQSLLKSITGTVKSNNGESLPGVTILIEGTSMGAVTDFDGNYILKEVPEDAILIFSFVGMVPVELAVSGQSVIDVTMQADAIGLEEVVAVGYGAQKKKDLTGSVSSINTTSIEKIAVSRVDDMLQGRMAGVQVSKTSGAPGGEVNIRIRGTNSITGNNQPLVVIDGFIGGDLATLNMDDVESMQVLKDASATAIYGSRASNGVIIVTTKKGSEGAPEITFNTFFTGAQVMKKYDLMNAGQYAEIVNEQFMTLDKSVPFSQSEVDEFYRTGGTDWQDEVFRTGTTQSYSLSIRGGGKNSRYFVSGGYQDMQGIVINSYHKMYNARVNLEMDLHENVKAGINLYGVGIEQRNVSNQGYDGNYGPILLAVSYAPTLSVMDPSTGDYSLPNASYGPIADNPVYGLLERNTTDFNKRINAIGKIEWQITKDLSLRSSVTYDYGANNRVVFNRNTPAEPSVDSYNSYGNNYIESFQNSNILNFKKSFGDHSLDASLIYEHSNSRNRSNGVNATKLTSVAMKDYSIEWGQTITGSSGLVASQLESYIGRVNYNLKDKYLLTATLRVDGSSKFAKDNRYSSFPSAAFGWRASEEDFIKSLNIFDNLKVRASWGATGNQGISPYETLPTMEPGINYPYTNGGEVSIGVAPNRIPNPDLKWETTYQTNIGIDFGFYGNRLYGSIDAYKKTTKDLLLEVQVPTTNGFGQMLKNIGEVENKGIELVLGGIPYDNGRFKWRVDGNISINRNRINELVDSENPEEIIFPQNYFGNRVAGSSPSVLIEGEPIGLLWGLTYLGPWQVDQTDEADQYGKVPGDANFLDEDGNKSYDDFSVIGDPNPNFTWGLTNNFEYKNFDLNVLITGVQGKDMWNFIRWQTLSEYGGIRNPTSIDYLDRWTPTNTRSLIPGISKTNVFQPQNTYFVEDASFVKLKDVTLGYTYKIRNSRNSGSQLRVYLSGQNLFVLTDYQGYDPEVDGSNSTGNGGASGYDTGSYPNAKSVTVGLSLTF